MPPYNQRTVGTTTIRLDNSCSVCYLKNGPDHAFPLPCGRGFMLSWNKFSRSLGVSPPHIPSRRPVTSSNAIWKRRHSRRTSQPSQISLARSHTCGLVCPRSMSGKNTVGSVSAIPRHAARSAQLISYVPSLLSYVLMLPCWCASHGINMGRCRGRTAASGSAPWSPSRSARIRHVHAAPTQSCDP